MPFIILGCFSAIFVYRLFLSKVSNTAPMIHANIPSLQTQCGSDVFIIFDIFKSEKGRLEGYKKVLSYYSDIQERSTKREFKRSRAETLSVEEG